MKRYVVFKEKLCSEDIGVYETFGIKSTSFDEGEKFSFSDISVDEAEVTKLLKETNNLCEKCNELDISPVHMTEIIEDFILNVPWFFRASKIQKETAEQNGGFFV